MKIRKVSKDEVIQMPAPCRESFDGWIIAKSPEDGLLITYNLGDRGGMLLTEEMLASYGYYPRANFRYEVPPLTEGFIIEEDGKKRLKIS
jgi:hypothetical protein